MSAVNHPDRRVTAHGKQVKLDGAHLADARDEQAAAAIALALNWAGVPIPRDQGKPLEELLA